MPSPASPGPTGSTTSSTSDVDIIVEAVSGSEPASDYVRAALLAGKSVVTANKQVDRAPRSGAAHAGRAAGTAAAVRGGRRRRHADRARARRRPGRRPCPAHRRHSERHEQRRAVAHGRTRVLDRRGDRRCVRARLRRGRPVGRSRRRRRGGEAGRSCARSAFGLRVLPAQIETRTTARIRPEDFRDGTAATAARSGRSRTPEYDRERSALSAWVAPMFVPRSSLFARMRRTAERRDHHRRVCRRDHDDRRRRRRRRDGRRRRSAIWWRSRATAPRSCRRRC